MTRRRVRPLSIVLLLALVVFALGFALVAHNVVRDQNRRLLRERAGEVGAVLTNSFVGVAGTLRSLSTVVHVGDATAQPFIDSATPLVVGQTRALLLVRVEGATFERKAMVGDGVPDGQLTGDRADLLHRAATEPGLVSGLVTDGLRSRVGLALGPSIGRDGWIVYQESALDPNLPVATTAGAPFSELGVALYAASEPRADRLVLATTRQVPLTGSTATASVPVGVDRWLVVVGSNHPLVGAFATRVPWILLIGGLVSALLAAMVVEVLGRRRDFALALVEERTMELRSMVTDLEDAQDDLVRHALYDGLTGLPNRTLFLNRLEHALERADRESTMTAVMFLDLDRFKWVNDSLGHDAGDRLLVAVAGGLADSVRPGDTVARLGGDEFVILCENVANGEEANAIAGRLRSMLAHSFEFEGRDLRPTASIGLALASGSLSGVTAESLLRDADLAMYRAKERGRDRVEPFDEPLRLHAAAQLQTEIALRRAVDLSEFVVHYQPIIDLAHGTTVGVEALVRWVDPLRGLVLPNDFIPMAEERGLIGAIDTFVLSEACSTVAEWNRARRGQPPLTVSVNLSARQLDVAGLTESVRTTLEITGLDPASLWLEITESTLMEDAPATLDALHALKALGVTLVIDDFGTGYSSLLYLRRFPVDILKVDQSFVSGLGSNAEDTAIVVGVVRLAQALGLSTVGEGVETLEQAEQLTMLGCVLGQGFHWSEGLPADELLAWLDQHGAGAGASAMAVARPMIRVLLVDDQPAVRDLVRLVMQLEGCFDIVAEAGNGVEAIELAATLQPDLVVLDLAMPVLDGAHALPEILAVSPHTKVVVLSAVDPGGVQRDGLEGAAGYFDKTADLGALIARLLNISMGVPSS